MNLLTLLAGTTPIPGARPQPPRTGAGLPVLPVVLGTVGLLVTACGWIPLLFLERTRPEQRYVSYVAPDQLYRCEVPAGWEISRAATQSSAGTTVFHQGTNRIEVTLAVRTDAGTQPAGTGETPLQQLHREHGESMTALFPGYSEGKALPVFTGMGEGLASEWLGNGGSGDTLLHGYRATVLTPVLQVTILCQSNAGEWPRLQPVYLHVITSMAQGGSP